jgi:RNA polymerase sigma-70 factor (ECF subfamily)
MDTEISSALARLWEAGRAVFPEATVDPSAFQRLVLQRSRDPSRIAALRGPDLYLACACAAGDRRALATFEARYLARIPAILARRERSPAVVDEVRQIVRTRLLVARAGALPRIAGYGGSGALEAWVRVVTLRVHGNLRRQDRDHEDIDALGDDLGVAADPEMLLVREHDLRALGAALRDAFVALRDRDRAVLRLQIQKGLTLDQIARALQVHRATAARWIAAARERLLTAVRSLLREPLSLDFADLVGCLGGRLDLSVSGGLGAEPAESAEPA